MVASLVTPVEVAAGALADLALGDPRWLPHPVVAIGRWATVQERWWRASGLPLRAAGVGAWVAVVGAAGGLVWASLRILPRPLASLYWIFSFLAARSLDDHARAVARALEAGDLDEARRKLSWIVGRETSNLPERDVVRGMVETVAENLSDGIVAPLFWLAIGGPPAMAAYKAVNTLDSMFGYRNDRYREFGWCSARADDLANLVPARLTAMAICSAAALLGLDWRTSIRITLRDAHRQPSPNSGYPEAAVAGALGVQLGGVNRYHGLESRKEFLGDDRRPLTWRTYSPLRRILWGVTAIAVAAVCWRIRR
jgi:adenosylcobinamide-phosphate synthase